MSSATIGNSEYYNLKCIVKLIQMHEGRNSEQIEKLL